MSYSHDFSEDSARNRQNLQKGHGGDTSLRWHLRENQLVYKHCTKRQARRQPEARDQEAPEISRSDQDMGRWERGERQGASAGGKEEDRKSRQTLSGLVVRTDSLQCMEQFKAVEKEMKTKAYSKEGLSQNVKQDPKER